MKVQVPGDKSLSHRRVLFDLLIDHSSLGLSTFSTRLKEVENLLDSEDIRASIMAVESIRDLGKAHINCGNSGTTARLILGLLAGNKRTFTLTGDESLSLRPMKRVIDYLVLMGCQVEYLDKTGYLPLRFTGVGRLISKKFKFHLSVASAQIKSALLLAGVATGSDIEIVGEIHSRDHTENILLDGGVSLEVDHEALSIHLQANQQFKAKGLSDKIASDPSSAAFWVFYGLVTGVKLDFENLCLNPTRIGFYKILKSSGAEVTWEMPLQVDKGAKLSLVSNTALKERIRMSESQAAFCIDEIPLLATIACFYPGRHQFFGARELKLKESNRLDAIETIVKSLGASFLLSQDNPDEFFVETAARAESLGDLKSLCSCQDHRIVMIVGILKKVISSHFENRVIYPDSVTVSYPGFWSTLDMLENEYQHQESKV